VNIASMPLGSLAHLPPPLKSGLAPAHSQGTVHSAFKGQLDDAIADRKGGMKEPRQRDAGVGAKPDTTKKKEDRLPQPFAVVVQRPTPPPPPAGSLGLPSAGVEAGSDAETAPNKTDAVEQSPIDNVTPDSSAKLAVDQSAPPAENVQPDQKTELAFALRLTDHTPDREATPAEATPAEATREPVMARTFRANPPAQPAQALQPDVKTKVAFTPLQDLTPKPAEATRPELRLEPVVTPLATSSPAPELAATQERTPAATPVKAAQPAQQSAATATPAVIAASSRGGATAETGSHSHDGHPSEKETPKSAQPLTAEPKSFRQPAATAQIVSSASKEAPLQTSGPTLTTAAPTPLTAPAPEPLSAVTAAVTPAELISTPAAPVQPNPATPVTEVSVTIPVPRADSAGNDNVAIRMMQRGSEIHVSVRTPDTQLADSLRHDLGKLATGLEQGGFRTETWRPTPTGAAAQSNTDSQHQSSQGNPQRDAAGPDGRSAGNSGQSAGEQKRKQQDERPRWVAELEQQRNR
jgi:hypothetical protein